MDLEIVDKFQNHPKDTAGLTPNTFSDVTPYRYRITIALNFRQWPNLFGTLNPRNTLLGRYWRIHSRILFKISKCTCQNPFDSIPLYCWKSGYIDEWRSVNEDMYVQQLFRRPRKHQLQQSDLENRKQVYISKSCPATGVEDEVVSSGLVFQKDFPDSQLRKERPNQGVRYLAYASGQSQSAGSIIGI